MTARLYSCILSATAVFPVTQSVREFSKRQDIHKTAPCLFWICTSGSCLRLQRPLRRLNICSCFALEVEPGADWKSLPVLVPGHVMTYFSVLCTVYSPPLRCFIWTFLTGIALNYARRGAFWPSLKMKYLLVFSLARDRPSPTVHFQKHQNSEHTAVQTVWGGFCWDFKISNIEFECFYVNGWHIVLLALSFVIVSKGCPLTGVPTPPEPRTISLTPVRSTLIAPCLFSQTHYIRAMKGRGS